MRKMVFAAVALAGLMSLGFSVKTFPSLWAPDSVEEGAPFPVKGTGFLPSTPLVVCEASFTACIGATTDVHGEFIQFRSAPAVSGSLSLKAIQSASPARRGSVGTRVLSASVTIDVVDSGSGIIGTVGGPKTN